MLSIFLFPLTPLKERKESQRIINLCGQTRTLLLTSNQSIECEGWRRHSSLIFLILLFTKPNIEVSGWQIQTKTHFTHIVYQPFSKVSPPSFSLYDCNRLFIFLLFLSKFILLIQSLVPKNLTLAVENMFVAIKFSALDNM